MSAARTSSSSHPALLRGSLGRFPGAALLLALAFLAAACSSSSDVETEDAFSTADDVIDNGADEADASTDTTASEDDAPTEVETETEAMGEDEESMTEDSTTTTTAAASGTTVVGGLSSDELNAALAASTGDRFSLPYMYLTVDQDCDGCASTMSLYYVPSVEKPSILTLDAAYVDGVEQPDFSGVDPVLSAGDPRRVAEDLDGTDATFGIDSVSGAIDTWTLDGNTVTIRCLQVDTRPIDMRTELCENSVIG